MSDHPDNIVLALLRDIRGDIGEMKERITDIELRISALEIIHVAMRRQLDRLGGDMVRVLRRLDIVEADAPSE